MEDQIIRILYPNAKLNLNLYIGQKKKTWWGDWFHEISSFIVPINIFDRMIFKTGKFNIEYSKIISFEDNSFETLKVEGCIIKKILKKFQLKEDDLNFNVTIEKNIPFSSGLGGPSTDAASFIKFLLEQNIIKFKDKKNILKTACEIGSDVPFFLYNRPAMVSGFGQKISTFKNFPMLYFVLIQPFKKISTKVMYDEIDKIRMNEKLKEQEFRKNKNIFKNFNKKYLQNTKNCVSSLSEIANNDFEIIVSKNYPEFNNWKLLFDKSLFVQISGAGSSIFGVYENYKDARICYDNLINIHGRVFICSCKI